MGHLRGLREDRVSMAIHRAIAEELTNNHDAVIQKARSNLDRIRSASRSPMAIEWVDEWDRLLDGPRESIIALILSDTEHAHDMRQMSPFAGTLPTSVRWAAIKEASRAPLGA